MSFLKKGQPGFTLIELLVVIAIIGLLASIVLVSLGNARQKGADAGIQGNLNSIRTQAEVYAAGAGNGNYATVGVGTTSSNVTCNTSAAATNLFGADPTIKQAVASAISASGGTVTCAVEDSPGFWAISVPLKSNPTNSWCVSSNGIAKTILTASPLTPSNTCL